MIGPNGQPFNPGLPPLVVTPSRADLDLHRIMAPDGSPAVLLTLKLSGYPVWLQVPVPAPAWERLVAGLGPVGATD